MNVEIVFVGPPIARDEVEEALEAAFDLDGEVTGGQRHGALPSSTSKSRSVWTCPDTRKWG